MRKWLWLNLLIITPIHAVEYLDHEKAIAHWIDSEFEVSTLTRAQQEQELRWFVNAAAPYRGMTIRVVSERIDTHKYEAAVLAKAFTEITGVHVVHEQTGEDDVIKKLQTQIQTGVNLYDAYINDSDLIGYHFRSGETVPISDFIDGEGKEVTLPTLDLDDFENACRVALRLAVG